MLPSDVALFLPISERTLEGVLSPEGEGNRGIAQLSVPEVAALIVLQCLPELKDDRSKELDRILVQAIASGNDQVDAQGPEAFTASAQRVIDLKRLEAGAAIVANFAVAFLDEETVRQRSYLTAEGGWDSSFRERHRARLGQRLQRVDGPIGTHRVLSEEQSRVFREVKAQSDDHLHVQGYAGTGKSYLIHSLLDMLCSKGGQILVLAERQSQLDAVLKTQGRDSVRGLTFGRLVAEMAPRDRTSPVYERMRRTKYTLSTMSDADLARNLRISASGALSPSDIAKVVRGVLTAFCYSDAEEIDLVHIPRAYAVSLDDTTRQVVLHHATELWKSTLVPPSREFQLPIRNYQRVKWAALAGLTVPAHYTHVLIDECHDLPKPMLQILDRSPQAVLSLGDEYQTLRGAAQQRRNVVRRREVTNAVRSGRSMEPLINPIIVAHPGRAKSPFVGNPLRRTAVEYYAQAELPSPPVAILVTDLWSLFEWSQRLATQKVDFGLIGNPDYLHVFVTDCIELYRHGTRPRHRDLFRFDSWETLAASYHDNQGFVRIDRMLRKGYSHEHWKAAYARLREPKPGGAYVLGLIEDARNREFDTVMLTPEAADLAWSTERSMLAETGSAIYVAFTRAQRRLIVPERLRQWIEEIAGSTFGYPVASSSGA